MNESQRKEYEDYQQRRAEKLDALPDFGIINNPRRIINEGVNNLIKYRPPYNPFEHGGM
jgi:hypothetical protein